MKKHEYEAFETDFLESVFKQIRRKDFIVDATLQKFYRYMKRAEEIAKKYGEEWNE